MASTDHLNYISCLDVFTTTYAFYHSHCIFINGNRLFDLISPGLFHELKTQSHRPSQLENIISTPSRYKLPRDISADNLIVELRTILAKCLVFIHTWKNENETYELDLNQEFNSYEKFFSICLSFISEKELNPDIKQNAKNLLHDISHYYKYLGSYHGHLGDYINSTKDLIPSLFLAYMVSKMVRI